MKTLTDRGCTCPQASNQIIPGKTSPACPLHGDALRKKVEDASPKLWQELSCDAEELLEGLSKKKRLECIVEFVLDADRLVAHGHLTKEEYQAVCDLPRGVAEKWAGKVLAYYA